MARDNRGDRGAMLVFASLLVVFALVIWAVPVGAYYYDRDGDGLEDFFESKHGIHGTVNDEGADWDGDGLTDLEEDANGNGIVDIGETDPYNYDTDGDGISDGIEGLEDSPEDADTLINALDWDSDGDFIPDTVEEQIQPGDTERDGVYEGVGSNETNWLAADTDGEGLIDGWEAMWGADPQIPNTDDDGWTDWEEVQYGTDPNDDDTDNDGRFDGVGNEDEDDADGDGQINAVDFDSDNDGLIDGDEDMNEDGVVDGGETDPELYDTDSDGYSDGYEIYEALTDPLDGGVDADGDGWMDGEETVIYKTDPNDADTDGDNITDTIENPQNDPGLDTDGDDLIDALDLDSDNDGIDDSEEVASGGDGYVTDPLLVDTDGDGLPDGAEVFIFGTDPTDANDPSDGDGIEPGDEIYSYDTNFDMSDTDEDGVDEGTSGQTDRVNLNSDGIRSRPYDDSSVNALDADADGDGIWDGDEAGYGTNFTVWDTDGDGLDDGEEVYIWGTDPTDPDHDDDGLEDGDEVALGTDPLDANTDDDFVDDGVEVNSWGSDPLDPDTDGDGILDGETINGTYVDGDGATQNWSFTENDVDQELGGDGLANVVDPDSDWREWEGPPGVIYVDFHDRVEIAYEAYVTAAVARGERFVIGPLNPGVPDTDGDGVADGQEVATGFDPLDARSFGTIGYTPFDTDGDQLYDLEEAVLEGTTPPTMHLVVDFDGDGLWDGDELHPSWWDEDGIPQTWPTNPLMAHSEQEYGYPWPYHDGMNDGQEVAAAPPNDTNPHTVDTDGDGLWDDDEIGWGYNPTDPDTDSDQLYDGFEDADGDGVVDAGETDPLDGDTEDDGIYDGPEWIFNTDPLDFDTDGDGLGDGLEVGYDAGNIGPDTDGLTFGPGDQDTATMTDPRLVDSDFDGLDDDVEDVNMNGALDPGETDAQDRDTDDDHLPDYYEVPGCDPLIPPADYYAVGWVDNSADATDPELTDTDGDGLEDDLEFEQMADPLVMDSDGDLIIDGDEYYSWETDPTNPDTDSDGCMESDAVVLDPDDLTDPLVIENVRTDADGDGAHNAMDVDSDNDWTWDGDDDEDCAGANDADGDGVPDILDNDSDNDNLSDRQEMGLNTWHVFADNDRDWDEDGLLDGDEYYQVLHQPHTGEIGFRASSPTLFDTDRDTFHDGFEQGMVGPIPIDPVFGGTNPDPAHWDFDGTSNSNVFLYDSDYDGLWDPDEDVNADGNDLDITGNVETDPEDDDTDDEGLIDGYEVLTAGTDPLVCDTDVDDLSDGLEHGLLGAMGSDTSIANPCLSNRYDTVEDGAYTTDPLDNDTDGDTLWDGADEDVDWDGFRDGNDPHDTDSDWGFGGETDPNVADTDRGGVTDDLDVDPLLYTTGDWDIDIDDDDADVVGNVLTIGTPGVGIDPGSNDTGQFVFWHTDGANNPDPGDGPSAAAGPIDGIYVVATSFHWVDELSGVTYSVPDTSMLHWFHYSELGYDQSWFDGVAVGTSRTVTVTANVPEGAMPGIYMGYIQVETTRAIEQELPDDWVEVWVYVSAAKDLDICDDDDDPIGVGLASDPPNFDEPAAIGEMHLVGAPMWPGDIAGMYRLANPNTNPDGVWPWPGGAPDGINDYNFFPAMPWIGRDWDLNTFDAQGNVNLTYDIRAEYYFSSGPMNPTGVIDFMNPLANGFELAEVDSFWLYVDTTTLVRGFYEGTVRVFEDIPHSPFPPNGTWDPDEVYDDFILKFQLILPDLDIDDDYANMSGNHLIIDVFPGDVQVMVGEIEYWCASAVNPGSNVDAVDGPGDEDFLDLQFYDTVDDELIHIPQDGTVPPVVFDLWNPTATQSIEATIDGLMGDGLPEGEAKRLRLQIPEVPANLPAGTYRPLNVAGWIPGDGTVNITARGVSTGLGDVTILQQDYSPNDGSEAGMGPGVVYDPDIDAVAELMDYFHLTVNVMAVIAVEWDDAGWAEDGLPGTVVCAEATVNNTGNFEVNDVHFESSALIGETYGGIIPAVAVGFDPSGLSIPYNESDDVNICVVIPEDMRADDYTGSISLFADGNTLFDELPFTITVLPVPAMEISDNAYNVVGNVMTLAPEPGWMRSDSGLFEIVNLGNDDLGDIMALDVAGLPDGLDVTVEVPETIDYDESDTGLVTVEWTDGAVIAGTHTAYVVVTAEEGTLEDSFTLDIIIAEIPAAEFEDEEIEFEGMAGEMLESGFTVNNIGNTDITEGLAFVVTDLEGETGSYISSDNIVIDPPTAVIPYADYYDFDIAVSVPAELLAQMYEGEISVFIGNEEWDTIPITVMLAMGDGEIVMYPNPYRDAVHDGGVTIAVGTESDNVTVNVYDMYGAKVAEIGSSGGRHTELVWDLTNDDGKSVTSGMYVVTVDTGDKVTTRKIMVIR